ncbi:MAG: hypothetical protein H9535_17340 [Ignavibacteria bacterium]|nr:hypothetical protein [Ignavibacteria bacterium]
MKSQAPSTLVLSAPSGRWKAKEEIASQAATMNGVEAWVYALGGDYLGYKQATVQDIARYSIVIANTNLSFLPDFIRLAESRPQHTRWVMLIEGGASDYILLNPNVQHAIAVSDIVNCINRYSLPLFQELARLVGSSALVEYIGIPYPVGGIRKYRIPVETRLQSQRKNLMLCPFLLTRSNDYAVAHALKQGHSNVSYYGYEQRLSRKWSNLHSFWENRSLSPLARVEKAAKLYADPHLEIRTASDLGGFFSQNADAFFWLNLDPRFTWARYVLDAAALGIPIITTASTGHGEILFPQTTLANEYQLGDAIELGRRLLDDASFYRSVAEYSKEHIESFSSEQCVTRLLSALYGTRS